MAYNAYDRFIAAVRKFPRWTNARRRPLESNGGKILRSIIEEIAAVEDAIIAYKKDFFIVNYIGREEEILDYIYSAHVGDIVDISLFSCDNPSLLVTEDKELFYQNSSYAYYENGYLVMRETNDENRLEYAYNGYIYYADIIENHVWNIFDEFAWWCGLERFEAERNAALLQRCLLQLHYDKDNPLQNTRPNSTAKGIKNAIKNAVSSFEKLSEDEIQILEPDENILSLKNENGITLYEEISRFNRDIARTRKWDIDYWDQNFRKLYYLPHIWDAEVNTYKNGVGYMDSLKISTTKETNTDGTVDVLIKGYIPSKSTIEQYIQKNDIQKSIPIQLIRYQDTVTPLQIQYQILAEDMAYVEDPDQVWFEFYKHRIGSQQYKLEDLVTRWSDNVTIQNKNEKLEPDTEYRLEFKSKDQGVSRMEIASCILYDNNQKTDKLILTESNNFAFTQGVLAHKAVWLHTSLVDNLELPENLSTSKDGDIVLTRPLAKASFQVSLDDFLQRSSRNLVMPISGGFQDITFLPQYVTATNYIRAEEINGWISPNDDSITTDTLVIESDYCCGLSFDIEAVGVTPTADFTVEIDGVKDKQLSYPRNMATNKPFNLEKEECHQIRIIIKRTSASGFIIKNIRMAAYQVNFALYNEDTQTEPTLITLNNKRGEIRLDRHKEGTCLLICNIYNYTAISPRIAYVHIGAQTSNVTYTKDFDTNDIADPNLKIHTNCQIALYKKVNNIYTLIDSDFHTFNIYENTGTEKEVLYLDLNSFSSIYFSTPTVKKYRDSEYTILLNPGEKLSEITISGDGYVLAARKTLKDVFSLNNHSVYLARAAQGIIIHDNLTNTDTIQRLLSRDFCVGDRIVIRSAGTQKINGYFLAGNTHYIGTEYTGAFYELYLYPDNAEKYVAYSTKLVLDYITLIPGETWSNNFTSERDKSKKLFCRISNILPDKNITVQFLTNYEERFWTIQYDTPIQIKAEDYQTVNPNIVNTEAITLSPSFHISNVLYLNNLTDQYGSLLDIGLYIVIPPEEMYVAYSEPKTNKQVTHPDGGLLYIEDDGFLKLKHSNIIRIISIKLNDGSIVPSSEYSLLREAGIIVWKFENTSSYWGQPIKEIEYSYKEAESLRYNDVNNLYDIVGYQIDAMECVNKRDYRVKAKNKDKIIIDNLFFTETPTIVTATCVDNPYYTTEIKDGVITVSKIAEDNQPVIHNGYYYIDGREYYYFANKKDLDATRVDGIDIQNGDIINHILYLKQEAVNYLKNSKMERNHMDIHCMVDFLYPRNRTNKEPLGHIGACESFSAWHDYAMSRSLTVYKNGYATLFASKANGYALLDITSALQGHTTISCLYMGKLTFSLAKEIKILDEQALKTVFCKKIASFNTNEDIAYYIASQYETDQYRYYLVVEGNGTLDEVLIHNAQNIKDIAAWHKKGIDMLELVTEDKETVAKDIDLEYSSDFMSYYDLETTADGYLRPGATIDWNITKLTSFDLSNVSTQNFLYRNNVLIAQKANATIETKPIEIKYWHSIKNIALVINDLVDKNFNGFTIRVMAAAERNGTYTQIRNITEENMISFSIKETQRWLKFIIEAEENKIVQQITLFATYKESSQEDLAIYLHNQGSAVTKVMDIGAKGSYKFKKILAEEGSSWSAIYIRGAKESINNELIWTTWRDSKLLPEFENCQLFQFKIIMNHASQKAKISAFQFEVLTDV